MLKKEQFFKELFGKSVDEVFEKDMLTEDELDWIRKVLSSDFVSRSSSGR